MQLKLFLIALVVGLMCLIHVLPVGSNFFEKLITIDKFAHGTYTKEVNVWVNKTEELKKEKNELKLRLQKEEEDSRLLRSEKWSEQTSKKQLERKLKAAEASETKLNTTVLQLQKTVATLEQEVQKSKKVEKSSNDRLRTLKDKEIALLKEAMSDVEIMK